MADTPQVLPNTKNDLIIATVQKNLIEKAVLAPTVRDLSAFAGKGVKSISVPKLTNFTVVNRAFGVAGDATALTDSFDNVALDFNAYIAWLYDSRDNYQSTISYQMEAAERAAAAHAKNVDAEIKSGLDTVAGISVSAAVQTDVRSQILTMRAALLNNGADISKMSLVIGPDKEAEMLEQADFIRADFYGSANVKNGQIGSVYGVPVIISRLYGAAEMHMYDSDGFGLAFQGGAEMSDQSANEYGANSRRVATDLVFGTGGLELGEQGVGGTESPLVAKLIA